MATDLLVGNSIQQGEKLLRTLDQDRFPVSAALWLLSNDTWKFVIASPVVDRDGPREAYRQVNEALRSQNSELNLSEIAVASPQEPLLQLLRAAIMTGPRDVSGIRFTANTINRVFVEDAYIYRLT